VAYRPKLIGVSTDAEHDQVSEVYHVISGSATLMSGSDIEALQRRPADNRAAKMLNGPGDDGKSIRNPATHQLQPGDVIVIPSPRSKPGRTSARSSIKRPANPGPWWSISTASPKQ
jgi:hypothetical protein